MKRRYRYALNVLSLGLLAFALYLNFVRKESADVSAPSVNDNSVTGKESAKQTSAVPSSRSTNYFDLK